jgi:UDP-3-O-[3-hydroxymyristoyl] glucosamine N-acyltransferase
MKIKDLAEKIKAIELIGNQNEEVLTASHFEDSNLNKSKIIWLNNDNISEVSKLKNTNVICSLEVKKISINENLNVLIVENPRKSFKEVIDILYPDNPIKHFISETAIIHPTAKLSFPVVIGNNTVIGEGCEISKNTVIGHNNVINNTIIEKNVLIGSNCTIGGNGFGYVLNESNEYNFIKHVGNVIIKNNCEIGNNVCIDRAVLGSTILEENVKVDNLVHIAHGVSIGSNSLIIAHSMIAGSVKIGKNVWVAPGACIKNKLQIGDNSVIGLAAVVLKNVDSSTTVIGNPAKPLLKK